MITLLLHVVNLFSAGILCGIEIGVHYGFVIPTQYLNEQAEIRLRQAMVLRLRILVPAFFVPTVISGAAVAMVDRAAPGFAFRGTAMLALTVWIVVRIVATVPINSATLGWDAESPPKNWRSWIDRVERFHIAGVWAAVVAFGAFLTAAALKSLP